MSNGAGTSLAALVASLFAAFGACAPLPTPAPAAPQPPQPAIAVASASASAPAEPHAALSGARHAVVAEHADAAAVADALLSDGASAADAAVAALLASGVAQPASSGLGGAGLGLYWDAARREATVVDFLATAPMGLEPADHVARPVPRRRRGIMIGTPGELAGLSHLHRRWGRKPWGEVVRPAIELADKGFTLSPHMHRALRWREPWLRASAPMQAVFAPLGKLRSRGDLVQRPALARTLRSIATSGEELFYRGPLAETMVEAAAAKGSRLSTSDLERYRTIERPPLRTTWAGHEVLAAPPPSAGGVLLLQTLHMHDRRALDELGHGTGPYLHVLAETFRGAHADRIRFLGDPDFVKMDVAQLVARDRMAQRRARIALDATHRPEAFGLTEGGTTNVIVVDAEGNVAIVTSSLNGLFGARVHAEGGVVLNDHLSSFAQERDWRRFGGNHHPNAPRGGARPVTSMSPTLALRDGKPVLALAASGGPQMATAVAQGVVARLAFGLEAQRLTGDVRIDAPAGGGLRIDPRADGELVADLRQRGEIVDASRALYGGLEVVTWSPDGRLEAAFDPRKGGGAQVR